MAILQFLDSLFWIAVIIAGVYVTARCFYGIITGR
jgi:hypothetical protein